jgi:hypothetical protein
MPDPVMLAIAGAVAGKTAEVALKGGRRAVTGLVDFVKARFAKEPTAQAALEAAQQEPDDNTEWLAAALELVAKADPKFKQQLITRWQEVEATNVASHGVVANNVSGRVEGSVTQVGSIGTANFDQRRI